MGGDAFHPDGIVGQAIVFAHRPQRRAGLEHVTAEVLNEAILVLFGDEVFQGAAGQVGPPGAVQELNDGGAFRANRAVHPDAGGDDALRFKAPNANGRLSEEMREAVREATVKGVENWQVNLELDSTGVGLRDYFKLDLFDEVSQ